MDGKDLARWTRFALKGGIGKCTAVQDCIAESPEDLMFLKDDEITVLLQLPTQAGWYLGYCEGVVGRFQGAHVQFHGKLKRPVKAKRASASAMSAASTPVQSATPSPRGPLSPLTISMPNSGSTPELTRDSTSFTNPFDLEFDSSLEVRDEAEADEERRPRRTRDVDHLPGLDMFLPRSRSGSRSRPSSLAPDKQARSLSSSQHGSPLVKNIGTPPSPPLAPSPLSKPYSASPEPVQVDESKSQVDSPEVEAPSHLDPVASEVEPDASRLGVDSEAESSRLYDAASIRSSFYSVNSYRSSVFGTNGQRQDDIHTSNAKNETDDDGLGMGIGLSMLQDLADDDEEDDADTTKKLPAAIPPELDSGMQLTRNTLVVHPIQSSFDSNETDNIVNATVPIQEDASRPVEDALTASPENPTSPHDEESDYPSDDESYWDGADIYDNYRYSRYSMMTKGSRRKSRFSMMSSSPFQGSPSSEVPPMPSEFDAFLHVDSPSRELSNGSFTEKRKVPPPLSLSSERESGPELLSPRTVKAPEGSPGKHSDASASPQPSPLLHTSFPSPTYSSHDAHRLSKYSDTPEPSPSPSAPTFSAASGGAASSLRQRLENDRPASPPSMPSLPPADSNPSPRSSENANQVGPDGGIVVDDDEEVNVTVVPADEDGRPKGYEDLTARESFQSLASQSSVVTTASDATDMSMSHALRKFEKDLEKMLPTEEGDTEASDYAAAATPLVTQPLRLGVKSASQPMPDRQAEMSIQTPPQRTAPVSHSQPPSTLRPGLLRPDQSPFMPHPNAPRPNPAVISGQRVSTYGMPPVHDLNTVSDIVNEAPNAPSLFATLRLAASARIGPAGVPHRPTIYGKPIVDLSNAEGPVPMMWSINPFPPDPPSAPGSPAMGGKPLRRAPTTGASPLSQVVTTAPNSPVMSSPYPLPGSSLRGPMGPSPSPGPSASRLPNANATAGPTQNVIPRPNFAPHVGAARPRSRSFSGFDRQQQAPPANATPAEERKPSRATSIQSLKEGSRQSIRQASGSVSSGRSIAPSPLSRSQESQLPGSSRSMSISKGLPSPLGRTTFSSSQTELPQSQTEVVSDKLPLRRPSMSAISIRQSSSVEQLKFGGSETNLVKPPSTIFEPVRRNSGPSETTASAITSPTASNAPSPIQRLRRLSSPTNSRNHQRTVSQQSRESSASDLRSTLTSPTGDKPSNSIKSRISLAHLRIRNSAIKEGGSDTHSPSTSTAPATPVYEYDQPVRVQDAEFEMIRPTIRRMSSEPASDSSVAERDDRASLAQEGRVESPVAGSIRSTLSPIPSAAVDSPIAPPSPIQPSEDATAHRARELKWMSAMQTTPAAQARKSKKIRRLAIEGVPSSVRYLVWGHLTDSKSRRIPGVYGEFGKRDVPGREALERDAARCFPGQPHLQDPKGPLVGLLKTYTILVPDLEYQSSLALVAGHLLLQSPEEDGFWTFVAMMDIQLRAYYSPKSVQLEADALVFGKAVESHFPSLHKKLFLELGISPLEVCRLWFPSLFSATLPQKHTNRIWDVYFCEGPPFIFRVALALLSLSRSAIQNTRDRTTVQALLAKPEVMSLVPDDPEELISVSLALKVKDDDLMKQRAKVESTLRQQQQSQSTPRSAPRLLSSISLPRPKAFLQS